MFLATEPVMLWVAGVVALNLLTVVFVLTVVSRVHRRRHEKREQIWRRFALENRLNVSIEPVRFLKHGQFRIQGRIGELDLELSTYEQRAGKSTQTWVRVASKGPGPAGSFSVQRKNLVARINTLLGAKSVAIEAEFDQQFLTISEPEFLAQDVLDERVRKQLRSLTRTPKLSYADGACDLVWLCGEESVEQLSEAVELLAMIQGTFARRVRVAT